MSLPLFQLHTPPQPETPSAETKLAYSTSSARWRAIVNRDAAATCFVYGVRTTKIYCRPRCPARLARRANVEFYDTPKQAEKAGYRPCKRCKPEDLRAPTDPHVRLAQKACETMTLAALAGGQRPRPTLQDLSSEAGLTPSHFHRVFKKVVGVTPGKYARELMDKKSMGKPIISGTGWPVTNVTAAAAAAGGVGQQKQPQPQDQQQQQQLPQTGQNQRGQQQQQHQQPSKQVLEQTGSPGQGVSTNGMGYNNYNNNNNHITNHHYHPEVGHIDWNEFDMMLAATSDPRQQQHHQLNNNNNSNNNNNNYPNHTSLAPSDSFNPNPAIAMSPSIYSPFDSTTHSQTDHLGFNEYMNMHDPIDFSLLPVTNPSNNNNANTNTSSSSPSSSLSATTSQQNFDLDPLNSAPAPSPTSVPSLHSQHSLSPTDSPLLFDSYSSLTGSPLLLDDVDWLESTGMFQQDYGTTTDHCVRS